VVGFIQSTVILSLLKENGWNIAEMVSEFLEIVLKGMERR